MLKVKFSNFGIIIDQTENVEKDVEEDVEDVEVVHRNKRCKQHGSSCSSHKECCGDPNHEGKCGNYLWPEAFCPFSDCCYY